MRFRNCSNNRETALCRTPFVRRIGRRAARACIVSYAVAALLAPSAWAAVPADMSADELRRSIEDRSKALQAINVQLAEAQKKLAETEERGKTLTRELQRIDYQVNQLNLHIKSNEVRIEKLLLEIRELELEAAKNEDQAARKRGMIAYFLGQLEEKERENVLIVFLTQRSLADSVRESQTLSDLNEQLTNEVVELRAVKGVILETLDQAEKKKKEVEAERQGLKNRKLIVQDERQERSEFLRTTKNQENLYEQQIRNLEKEQAAIAAEIEEVEKVLRTRINPDLLPVPRPGLLAWPAASAVVSQGYGQTDFARRNYKGRHHNGVDIAGPVGTEVYAAEKGEVVVAGNQDRFCPRGAYGKYIVIRHENGLTTLYGHLSRQTVVAGDKVNRGDIIAYMGRSGWATGPHLHFTAWSTPTYTLRSSRTCGPMPVGGDINPAQYLGAPGVRG